MFSDTKFIEYSNRHMKLQRSYSKLTSIKVVLTDQTLSSKSSSASQFFFPEKSSTRSLNKVLICFPFLFPTEMGTDPLN